MPTHAVTVDEESLRAALAAEAARDVPPSPAPGVVAAPGVASAAPVSDPLAWINEARLLASFLAHKVTPNWQVTPEVQEQWASALSACLDKLMPGGLGNVAQWGPWSQLAYASAAWALCGFDVEKFQFRSLYAAKEKKPRVTDTGEEGGGSSGEPVPSAGGTFTTGG